MTVWLPTDSQKPIRQSSPTHTHAVTPTPTPTPTPIKEFAERTALKAGLGDSWQPDANPTPLAPTSWWLDPTSTSHGIFVTHNGDFESYKLFGHKKSTAEMMAWLAAVLHVRSPASCDSVAIAGQSTFVCPCVALPFNMSCQTHTTGWFVR